MLPPLLYSPNHVQVLYCRLNSTLLCLVRFTDCSGLRTARMLPPYLEVLGIYNSCYRGRKVLSGLASELARECNFPHSDQSDRLSYAAESWCNFLLIYRLEWFKKILRLKRTLRKWEISYNNWERKLNMLMYTEYQIWNMCSHINIKLLL